VGRRGERLGWRGSGMLSSALHAALLPSALLPPPSSLLPLHPIPSPLAQVLNCPDPEGAEDDPSCWQVLAPTGELLHAPFPAAANAPAVLRWRWRLTHSFQHTPTPTNTNG
jgi:hypothetical protein